MIRALLVSFCFAVVSPVAALTPSNGTLLFDNLQRFVQSVPVGDPAVSTDRWEDGPKGVAHGDLDGDGLVDLATGDNDGTITVLFGKAGSAFQSPIYLNTGDPRGIRDVIFANVSGDNRPEIIAAHPFSGKLFIFEVNGSQGSRNYVLAREVITWKGARSVVQGDFNGDAIPDLAVSGAGDGFREYRGDGLGGFTPLPVPASIEFPASRIDDAYPSAAPVFAMQVWRKPGDSRDQVVLAHANSPWIYFFRSLANGQPLSLGSSLNVGIFGISDVALGTISPESRASGQPDLITTSKSGGEVSIRKFRQAAGSYPESPDKRLTIAGGPRAVAIADVDGDTWPELMVASKWGDTLWLFKNTGGDLNLVSRTPSGSSPRDIVGVDCDSNGLPDLVAINRYSQNVTVHRIDPSTAFFYQSTLVQDLPFAASQLAAKDLDGDGRDELLYSSYRDDRVWIRKVNGTAFLSPPVSYRFGVLGGAIQCPDLNGDGRPDLAIGFPGWTNPAIPYRLQMDDHSFGPVNYLPCPTPAPPYALDVVFEDFNADGISDYVLLAHDTLYYYESVGPTSWVKRRADAVSPGMNAMLTADLDRDGDSDLIGYDTATQALRIIENTQAWRAGSSPLSLVERLIPQKEGVYWFHLVTAKDVNQDGYPDLHLHGWPSTMTLHGGAGLTFSFAADAEVRAFNPVIADFDGNGSFDAFSVATGPTRFFSGSATGPWLSSPVNYSGTPCYTLATGDFDGDGIPDLAGVGNSLWVALSSEPAPALAPRPFAGNLIELPQVVINEVLSSTEEYIAPGMAKPQDCVELFNGTSGPADLSGWKLRLLAPPGETQSADYTFPPSTVLAPYRHTVVYCTGTGGPTTAPFKLPAGGSTLRLIRADGTEADYIVVPALDADISYARVNDGARALYSNPLPSIGSGNYENGDPSPKLDFRGVDLDALKTGNIRLRAAASASSGLGPVWANWKATLPNGGIQYGNTTLGDFGRNGDAVPDDGIFTGDLPLLPKGTQIEFFLQTFSLFDYTYVFDKTSGFTPFGFPVQNYSLSLPVARSGWEISEVVSRNTTGLKDELGLTADWAEIRFTSPGSGSTAGLYLADSLFEKDAANLYQLSRSAAFITSALPIVVFLDGTAVASGRANHAPFKVDSDGDTIYLFRILPSGVREIVDWVKIPPLEPDLSYARIGIAGDFFETQPTPGRGSGGADGELHIGRSASGLSEAVFAFTGAGWIEASTDLKDWTPITGSFQDDGLEHVVREPLTLGQRFYRIRNQ